MERKESLRTKTKATITSTDLPATMSQQSFAQHVAM